MILTPIQKFQNMALSMPTRNVGGDHFFSIASRETYDKTSSTSGKKSNE